MIFHPNFRISKNLDTKFLDIQGFGWLKEMKISKSTKFDQIWVPDFLDI